MTWVIHQLEKVPHSPWAEVRQDEAVGLWKLLHNFEVGQEDQLVSCTGKPFLSVHLNIKKVASSLAKQISSSNIIHIEYLGI